MYSEQDEIIIQKAFDDLMESCRDIRKSEEDTECITNAFLFAKDAHEGVRRKSGDPYITHPIAVAKIVVDEIGLGVKSVVSALLHDVVEDTDYTVEDIERRFGKKIASMVDGLTKMAGVFTSQTSEQAENFRKVLLTLSDDVRVILIKLADRLHNMRTLDSVPVHKQMKIASETIYLFAPLAHRLGLYSVKSEMEDLSLKFRFPEEYNQIVAQLEKTEAERSLFIEKFNAPIIEKLNENGVDFEITGRVKSVYSIWKKMQMKQVPFQEIFDLFAIRIIFEPSPYVPEKSQCWYIYSLITDIYKPKPDRIRDWVNIPKANGYEALHCTVMGPDGVWAEVQIRSRRMDEIAERGFAAHWRYKEAKLEQEGELDKWIRKVREALNSPTESAVEFLENFKMNLYTSEVVVFTPKGETRTLPKGATVLDFAYDIHSKVGNSAIGAKVNHNVEMLYTQLKTGDQIEIITSNVGRPKVEWLKHAVTVKARQAIKNFLKKENQNNIERGIEIFESKMKEFRIQPSARVFRKILPVYESANKDEFYSKLGAGIIHLDQIEKVLKENSASKLMKYWTLQFSHTFKFLSGDKEADKRIRKAVEMEDSEPSYVIAECCNPIPGDEVIGFKDGKGVITVHKKSCPEAIKIAARQGKNIVPAKWSSQKVMSFLSHISIRGIDRIGLLFDLAQKISGELSVNIRKLHIESHDGIFEGYISLYVKNRDDLKKIMAKVSKVKGVEQVKRVETVSD